MERGRGRERWRETERQGEGEGERFSAFRVVVFSCGPQLRKWAKGDDQKENHCVHMCW